LDIWKKDPDALFTLVRLVPTTGAVQIYGLSPDPGPVVRASNNSGFHGFGPGPVVRGFNCHDYGNHHYGYRPYGYWDDYAYDYPYYTYDDSYYDDGSCYVLRRQVHSAQGWRLQPHQVCG
jgi:hypothetical protein